MLIENSVTRVTVRHQEACRVMPNSYPSDGIFNLHQRSIMDSFSCTLFLRQLHLDLNMCCCFFIKKGSVRFLSYTLTSKSLAETDVKMTSISSYLCPFPSPGRVHGNPGRVCKNNVFNSFCKVLDLYVTASTK